MADTSDPNRPPQQRPNPSVESTRKDDEYDKKVHEEAGGAGAALGTGLGCLGIALGPWAAMEEIDDADRLNELKLLAPVDGRIVERQAVQNARVDAAAPLFVVADMSTMWVSAATKVPGFT